MLFKKVNILLLLCLFSIKSFAVYKLWTYDNGGSRYPSDIILQKTLIVDFVSDKGDAVTLFGNTIKPLVGHNIYQFDNYTHEINIGSNDTIYSVSCESNNYENQVFTRSDKTYSTGYSLEDLAITSEYAPPNIHGDAKENNDEWINTDNKNIWE